jgi:hypothetical protein
MVKALRSGPFAALFITMLFPAGGRTQTVPPSTDLPSSHFRMEVYGDALADFTARTEQYFELRDRLERGLPAATVTEDVRQIRRRTHALATAIRAARPGAVQGEFFTVTASAELKRILAARMNTGVWSSIMGENPGAFRRDIDASYPEGKPYATTPGILLQTLPQLPDDIQYRFVGSHLILYDLRANTIIDRLPNAIVCSGGCEDESRLNWWSRIGKAFTKESDGQDDGHDDAEERAHAP